MTFKKGKKLWVCDGCGKEETWRKGWSYLPGVESRTNPKTADGRIFPMAGCSEKCVDKALENEVKGLLDRNDSGLPIDEC